MIAENSIQFKFIMKKLNESLQKTNRDLMCIECWRIYSYDKIKVHKIQEPSHERSIITAKEYASQEKFIELSQELGKY